MDELLVELLRGGGAYAAYHLEVYQQAKNAASYPCYVYRATDDDPLLELNGDTGYYYGTYEVTAVSRDSDTLRAYVERLKTWNNLGFLTDLQVTRDDVEDVTVTMDSEGNEFSIEQEEKGYKVATLLVEFAYSKVQGKTDAC